MCSALGPREPAAPPAGTPDLGRPFPSLYTTPPSKRNATPAAADLPGPVPALHLRHGPQPRPRVQARGCAAPAALGPAHTLQAARATAPRAYFPRLLAHSHPRRWFSGDSAPGSLTVSSCGYTNGDPCISVLSSPNAAGGPWACVGGQDGARRRGRRPPAAAACRRRLCRCLRRLRRRAAPPVTRLGSPSPAACACRQRRAVPHQLQNHAGLCLQLCLPAPDTLLSCRRPS